MQRKECCPFLVSRCLAYSDDPRWSSCRLFPTTHADLSPLALSFMAVMLLRPLWILVLASLFSAAGKYNVKLKQTSYNYMYWSAVRCSLPAGPVDDDFRSPLLAQRFHAIKGMYHVIESTSYDRDGRYMTSWSDHPRCPSSNGLHSCTRRSISNKNTTNHFRNHNKYWSSKITVNNWWNVNFQI